MSKRDAQDQFAHTCCSRTYVMHIVHWPLACADCAASLCQVEHDIHTARLNDAADLADEHERLRVLFQQRVSVAAV